MHEALILALCAAKPVSSLVESSKGAIILAACVFLRSTQYVGRWRRAGCSLVLEARRHFSGRRSWHKIDQRRYAPELGATGTDAASSRSDREKIPSVGQ